MSFLVATKLPLDLKLKGPAFDALVKSLKKEAKKSA
jgi:hypothetical protein